MSRVEWLGAFAKVMTPCLSAAKETEVQLFRQMAIVQLQIILEGYFRCLVSMATFWDPQSVRAYLSQVRPDQARNIAGLTVPQLTSWAVKEVAFSANGNSLKSTIDALFGVPVFPDSATERRFLDLVAVRNIVVHQVGTAEEKNVATVRSKNVIVHTTSVGEAHFYRLEVTPAFFAEVSEAVVGVIRHLETTISADPRFRMPA